MSDYTLEYCIPRRLGNLFQLLATFMLMLFITSRITERNMLGSKYEVPWHQGTFKKYVHSRFPSFDPLPLCSHLSPSKNQRSSKVNMKSTICYDFPSPDLLEGPKDGKCIVFLILKSSNKVHYISTLSTLITKQTLSITNE